MNGEVMGRKVLLLSTPQSTLKGGDSETAISVLLGTVTKQCDQEEFGNESEHRKGERLGILRGRSENLVCIWIS